MKTRAVRKLIAACLQYLGFAVQLCVEQDAEALTYAEKEEVTLLGEQLDHEGDTATSTEYNLSRAEAHYFKHQSTFRNRSIPIGRRLRAWGTTTVTMAMYNCGSWHINKSIMSGVRT